MNGIQKYKNDFAMRNQLQVYDETGTVYGNVNGYLVTIQQINNTYTLQVNLSVCKAGEMPMPNDIQAIGKEVEGISGGTVQRYRIGYVFKGNKNKVLESSRDTLYQLTSLLHAQGYENCCEQCGAIVDTAAYAVKGYPMMLCEKCFEGISNSVVQSQYTENQKQENVLSGTIGALLGSLIGAAVIVVLGQLGFVAAISGIVMAVCSIKGYELLGGKLSKRGIVICAICMIVMTCVGYYSDWAITVAQYFEVDFFTAFSGISSLLDYGMIDSSTFYANLALVYLFVLVGAVPMMRNTLKAHNVSAVTCRMSNTNYQTY